MAFNLAPNDRDALSAVRLKILEDPAPVDGFPAGNHTNVPFQFPPRIMSASKAIDWDLRHAASYEEVAVYRGAKAKQIEFEITYIVTGHSDGNTTYNASTISDIVRTIFAHAYRTMAAGIDKMPLFSISALYGIHGSGSESFWRLSDSIQVNYEGQLIFNGVYHPLMTKITLPLAQVTQVGDFTGFVKQQLSGVPATAKNIWY